jgi:diguanylate cyclase (GGDEF)-like protein
VLAPAGYWVVRTSDDVQSPEAGGGWDIILVASPHTEAVEVCRRLRREAAIASGTPVVIISTAPAILEHRLAGLRAGAWDVLAFPLNAQELLARIDGFVSVKVEADRVRTEGLLDSFSGLYAIRGVEYRARELLADAERNHLALACVVLGAEFEGEMDPAGTHDAALSARVLQHVAKVLRTHGRLSDVIGRYSDTEFAVLAPGTRALGAARLAQRLAWLVETRTSPDGDLPPMRVRGGYEAVDDASVARVRAQDLLTRAHAAFRTARVETSLPHIRQYAPAMAYHGPVLLATQPRGLDAHLPG